MDEGIELEGMMFEKEGNLTHVIEDNEARPIGFFTLAPLRGIYLLQHLCIQRSKRSHEAIFFMWRSIKEVMRGLNCPVITTGIPHDKPGLKKITQWVFKSSPYEETESNSCFSMNILGGI